MLGPIVVHLHHQAMASQNFASWSSALGPKIYSSLGITFQLKYSFLLQQYSLQDTTFIYTMFNKRVAANYVTSMYMDLFLLIKQLITKNKRSVYQNNKKVQAKICFIERFSKRISSLPEFYNQS
jgi:hypothetical protein